MTANIHIYLTIDCHQSIELVHWRYNILHSMFQDYPLQGWWDFTMAKFTLYLVPIGRFITFSFLLL